MLVLTRRTDEKIVLELGAGKRIAISVCGVQGGKVQIGIEAPPDVRIARAELLRRRSRGHSGPKDGKEAA